MGDIKQPTQGKPNTYYVPFPVLALGTDEGSICCSAGGGGAAASKEVPNNIHAHKYDEATKQFSTIAALNTEKELVTALHYVSSAGVWLASVRDSTRVLVLDEEENKFIVVGSWVTEKNGKDPSQNFAHSNSSGELVATGGTDDMLQIWKVSLDGGDLNPTLVCDCRQESEVLDAAFSADSKLVASTGRDKACRIWDAQTGQSKHTISYANPNNPKDVLMSRCVQFWIDPQGQERLFVAAHGARGPSMLGIFTLEGQVVYQLSVDQKPLSSMCIDSEGKRIAIGITTGSKKVYALPTFKMIGKIEECHDMPASNVGFMGETCVVSGAGDYSINVAEFRGGSGGSMMMCVLVALIMIAGIFFMVFRLGSAAATLPENAEL